MHKLLARQLRRVLQGADPPDAWRPLLEAVDATYRQHDEDRALLERSLELTSRELLEQNERLRRELEERDRIAATLQRSQARLAEAQRMVGVGSWEWDLEANRLNFSPEARRIFDLEDADALVPLREFLGKLHPEDRARVARIARSTDEHTAHEYTARVLRRDGTVSIVRGTGQATRREAGRTVRGFGICVDITEQQQHEEELVAAKEQAEELLRLKSAFLNNMSHELRTPLTGILGFAEVLSEEIQGDHREFAELIGQSARRLLGTVNSVLDLAQLEGSGIDLNPRPLDVAAEVAQATNLLRPLADQKGLMLRFVRATADATAYLDAACLHRIVNNLAGNAIKFTETGHVTIEVATEAGDVVLTVADTGIGIDAAFLPHLFTEFRQASTGLARSHEGTGLGLTITKRLVDLSGGRLSVESRLGGGTTFTVRFPHTTAEPAETDGTCAEAPAGERSASPSRVLVVEDNPETLRLVRRMLGPRFTVETAPDAPTALGMTASTPFDALLLDINLGEGLSGVDLLRELRARPSCAHTPAVALTAYALPGDRERFLAAGFDAYVSKPFTRDGLLEALAAAAEQPAA